MRMMRSSLWVMVMMLKVRMSKCRVLIVRDNSVLFSYVFVFAECGKTLVAREVKVLCMASNWPPVYNRKCKIGNVKLE